MWTNLKSVKSDDSTFPFQGIEKEHRGKMGKICNLWKHRKTSKILLSSVKSNSSATATQAFWTRFFSLSDLWLLSHKQGYFWTATARSSSSSKVKEVPLLELLLFWFYTFSQVFFYLIFFIIYKKILSSYRNVFFNISWEQFLPALFYVTEFELNTSVVISKKISFRVKT